LSFGLKGNLTDRPIMVLYKLPITQVPNHVPVSNRCPNKKPTMLTNNKFSTTSKQPKHWRALNSLFHDWGLRVDVTDPQLDKQLLGANPPAAVSHRHWQRSAGAFRPSATEPGPRRRSIRMHRDGHGFVSSLTRGSLPGAGSGPGQVCRATSLFLRMKSATPMHGEPGMVEMAVYPIMTVLLQSRRPDSSA